MRLRVADYNVRSFRAGVDAVAKAIAPEKPEVLLLQECGSRWKLRRFAGRLDMEFVSSHRPFVRVRNAVLFRPDWRLSGFEVRDFSHEGRRIRRGLVAATLRRMGVPVTAVSSHLGLAPVERERHARELTDFLAGVNGRPIVGADLNEGPEGAAARWISDRLYDAFKEAGEGEGATFPAQAPTARIDYLFSGDGVKAESVWVPANPEVTNASDHRPVVAELEIAEP